MVLKIKPKTSHTPSKCSVHLQLPPMAKVFTPSSNFLRGKLQARCIT